MHWHGLNQRGTPYYDGVSAVSHCPIVPGECLTYRFRADSFGTTWYHAHFSAQYSSGVVGPMLIYGPSQVEYDVDLQPILISDWYHADYQQLVEQTVQTGVTNPTVTRPRAVSNLVAGLGVFSCVDVVAGIDCDGGSYASIDFVPGMTYRLRLVNTGSVAFEQISIDDHNMTIITNDFVPVEPYETSVVTLGVGQRTDVIVTATGQANQSYWFRAWNHPLCGDNAQPDGRAIIFYPNADRSLQPTSDPTPIPLNNACQNDALSLSRPVYAIPVTEPDVTLTVTMTYAANATKSFQWLMNGLAWKGDLNIPLTFDAINGTTEFPPERVLYNLGTNTSIRIVFINTYLADHPMHQHGHNFQVLAEGYGVWDGTITNPDNPQRRDVHMSWSGASPSTANYMVIQFDLDNPGVWPFHCHIAWHLSAGMAVMFLERPDELVGMKIPQDVLDTCAAWDVWQQTHVTDVVDSAKAKREDVVRRKL
jgi:FtsP/CotA-like multicopper oxidase with cupredoxin domain